MLNPPVQMALLQLPLEVLYIIVEYLNQPALNALCCTCHATHSWFLQILFKYNVEHKEASGLFWAAIHNRPDVATTFLDDYGADINAADVNGDTALHHVVRHGNTSVMKCLLKDRRIDANNKSVWNATALHVAVQNLCICGCSSCFHERYLKLTTGTAKKGLPLGPKIFAIYLYYLPATGKRHRQQRCGLYRKYGPSHPRYIIISRGSPILTRPMWCGHEYC